MKRVLKIGGYLSLILVFFLCFTDVGKALSENMTVTPTPTQQQIADYVQTHPTGPIGYDFKGYKIGEYKINFIEAPLLTAPYKAGKLADPEQTYALNTLKTIRYMAGLSDDIYVSDVMVNLAQASCIVNYANGSLTHNPTAPKGMTKALAQSGISGASLSNIARVSWKNNSLKWCMINGWMYDGDRQNIASLGHRRWILNPSMGMTGFGSVTGPRGTYSAMYALDASNRDNRRGAVMWPSANTPVSYFPAGSPWSISYGSYFDKKDVVVSITRISDSKIWTFSIYHADGEFYIDNSQYGRSSCIIFKPAGLSKYKPGDSFIVNVLNGGKRISYTVNFFDLEGYYSTEAPEKPSAAFFGPHTVALNWDAVKNADSYDVYRKTANGKWKLLISDLDEPSFLDSTVGRGMKYYYRIVAKRAIKASVYESDFSKAVSLSVPLSKVQVAKKPAVRGGKAYLSWTQVSKATGYKIYRKGSGQSSWSLIGKTTGTSYGISLSYRPASYKVRAYRTYKGTTVNGYYSEEAELRR